MFSGMTATIALTPAELLTVTAAELGHDVAYAAAT